MEKIIKYFGRNAKVNCDENCSKAWGNNCRAKNQLSDDEDDYEFLSDDELGEALVDPGTYEGGQAKPINKKDIPNKWCVRECERSNISNPGESHLPLEIRTFVKRCSNLERL